MWNKTHGDLTLLWKPGPMEMPMSMMISLVKHGLLENALAFFMEVLKGKSSINRRFSIVLFDYGG